MKFISWFSGGGLADIGAKAAGFELIAANEIDPKIADVYRRNHGDHIRVGDVLDENPKHYPDCDLFHASPVCTNASIANTDGEESPLDIATAKKTAEFIRVKKPRFVTLENVTGYRHFTSFKIIMSALDDLGYFYDVSNFNSADFGVPQTRRRLIVRAVRGGFVPPLPAPRRWVGWYEAVEDILHTFPETKFAPWQMARLPITTDNSLLIAGSGNTNFNDAEPGAGIRTISEPSHTITASGGGRIARAFLVGQQKFNDRLQIKDQDAPADTVTANKNQRHLRAFVVSGGQAQNYNRRSADGSTTTAVIRKHHEPVFTIVADMPRQPARAWLDQGRVVRITPRGLARFQSVPDWYELPEDEPLACKVIGNGVPSKMYEAIACSFKEFYG
jgi:DNA (cytosine-5)-methyltransferase 1